MHPEILLPGDTVYEVGSVGNTVYFVKRGTIQISHPDLPHSNNISDGAMFGETAFLRGAQMLIR